MRVVVDIQAALAQRAGVGRYTKSLVQALIPMAGSDELSLFCFDFLRRGVPFATGANVRAVRWVPGRLVQQAWKRGGGPAFDFFAGPADVFHFPNFVAPPVRKGRVAVTIHDVVFKRLPHTVEPNNLDYMTARVPETLKRADRVIAVSQCTARDLEEFCGVPGEKITVIYEGVDDHLKRPNSAAIAAMRERLELNRPYLLMVGTIEPRKNIPFLVDVFETLGDFDGDLVLAGMRGWRSDPIIQWMRNSTRAAQIRWLEYVPEEHLAALYAGAELLVFPSLYEGFGFPPLEAMLCGTPVVTSRGGALPEILGDACVYVEEFEVQTWADAIHDVLNDAERRAALAQKGLERAGRYTWAKCAAETWKVYRELGGRAG
jgi:glycosyltransferase involved in cell wall biosynthesis